MIESILNLECNIDKNTQNNQFERNVVFTVALLSDVIGLS